jgi:hypothetical protein
MTNTHGCIKKSQYARVQITLQTNWTQQPNATGYFMYEATEASLLDAWGLPESAQTATLDSRMQVLKTHFKTGTHRRTALGVFRMRQLGQLGYLGQ